MPIDPSSRRPNGAASPAVPRSCPASGSERSRGASSSHLASGRSNRGADAGVLVTGMTRFVACPAIWRRPRSRRCVVVRIGSSTSLGECLTFDPEDFDANRSRGCRRESEARRRVHGRGFENPIRLPLDIAATVRSVGRPPLLDDLPPLASTRWKEDDAPEIAAFARRRPCGSGTMTSASA